MTLEEIKAAIEAGKRVYWANRGYEVKKNDIGQYIIVCGSNSIGLTWADGVTMNGKEKDFFVA